MKRGEGSERRIWAQESGRRHSEKRANYENEAQCREAKFVIA